MSTPWRYMLTVFFVHTLAIYVEGVLCPPLAIYVYGVLCPPLAIYVEGVLCPHPGDIC